MDEFVLKPEKAVLVDCDGVLHPYSKGWNGGLLYDDPLPQAKWFLETLKNKGYQVVIFTARLFDTRRNKNDNMMEHIVEWLNNHNLPFDFVTGNKLPAVAYVDDRGVHFNGTNWDKVLEQIDKLADYDGRQYYKDI